MKELSTKTKIKILREIKKTLSVEEFFICTMVKHFKRDNKITYEECQLFREYFAKERPSENKHREFYLHDLYFKKYNSHLTLLKAWWDKSDNIDELNEVLEEKKRFIQHLINELKPKTRITMQTLRKILLTILSIVLATVATLLLLGELREFDYLLFLVKTIVGMIVLGIATIIFPFSLNLSLEKEEKLETIGVTVIIVIVILTITYYSINNLKLIP